MIYYILHSRKNKAVKLYLSKSIFANLVLQYCTTKKMSELTGLLAKTQTRLLFCGGVVVASVVLLFEAEVEDVAVVEDWHVVKTDGVREKERMRP